MYNTCNMKGVGKPQKWTKKGEVDENLSAHGVDNIYGFCLETDFLDLGS